MFISFTDFDMGQTDSSYFSITVIDPMGQPEETIRFDRKTNDVEEEWIQAGFLKNRLEIEFWLYNFFKALLSYLDQRQFLNFRRQMDIQLSRYFMNVEIFE